MINDKAKWLLLVVGAGFSLGLVLAVLNSRPVPSEPINKPVVTKPKPTNQPKPVTEEPVPEKAKLNVPFYSQAPFGIWDELHGEACEEASLHMVRDYYRKKSLDREEQDQLIINFVRWQTDNGYKIDLTLKQLATAAQLYYGFGGGRILEDPTISEIKALIAAGHPVIVPAAGRLLDNPNFRSPGPIYHMLVITGYDQRGFITNDPGTRNGEDFRYSYDNLYQAIHDWNPSNILAGQKSVLTYGSP